MSLKKHSKISPIELDPLKINNLFSKRNGIVDQLKSVLSVQIALGINRIYLMNCKKLSCLMANIYSLILIILAFIAMINNKSNGASNLVVLDTTCVQFILLALNAMLSKQKTFEHFFANMKKFDDILNINKDLSLISPVHRNIIWMLIGLIYNMTECVFLMMYVQGYADYTFAFIYVTILTNDSEQVLFCSLIRMILMRVYIVKAHIAKAYDDKKSNPKPNKMEALSNNTLLDIGTLHRVYELLHKCAEQLNSIMSFPVNGEKFYHEIL